MRPRDPGRPQWGAGRVPVNPCTNFGVRLVRQSPAHGQKAVLMSGPTGLGAAADEAARLQKERREARQMKQCPTCGHVYKQPGLALPDGTCRSQKACARHIERGY